MTQLARLRRAAQALIALCALSCGESPRAEDPLPRGETMQIHVSSPQDFARLNQEWSALVHAPATGRATEVEILLAPGSYAGTHLILRDVEGHGEVDLSLRSEGPGLAIFDGANLDISTRSARVQDLLFTGSQSSGQALHLRARASLSLTRVGFQGKQLSASKGGSQPGRGLLHIEAAGEATQATLSACWFVENELAPGIPALRLEAMPGKHFSETSIVGSFFVNNQGAPLLLTRTFEPLRIVGSLILSPPGAGPFLSPALPRSNTRMEGSWILLDRAETLVKPHVAPELSASDYPPATLVGSTLRVREGGEAAGLLLEGTTIQPATEPDPGRVGALVKRLAAGERVLVAEVAEGLMGGLR